MAYARAVKSKVAKGKLLSCSVTLDNRAASIRLNLVCSNVSLRTVRRPVLTRVRSLPVLRGKKDLNDTEIHLSASVRIIEQAPADLGSRIKTAPTIYSLIDLVGNYISLSQERSLTVWVLVKLTKLLQNPNVTSRDIELGVQLLKLMLPNLQEDIQNYDSSALSILAYALGTIGCDRFGLAPQILVLSRKVMRHFLPEGLSKLLWGLAVLKQEPSEEWMEAALQAAVYNRSFHAKSYVRFLQALAMLHYAPAKADVDTILLRVQSQLASLKAAEMAVIMWALSTLRIQPVSKWLQEFYAKSRKKLAYCGGGELGAFAAATVVMRHSPDAWWMEHFLKQSQLRLQWCTCSETVDILCCACQFNMKPGKFWLQHCLTHLQGLRGQLTCRQLVLLIHALSLLPPGHPTVVRHKRWLSECMLQLQHRLSGLQPIMLAKALSGGVKLELSLSTDWIEDCYDVLDNCLANFNSAWVAHIIHVLGLAKRRFKPHQTKAWLERTQSLLPEFSVEDMLMVIIGLAKLDLEEDDRLHALTSSMTDRLCTQDVTDLAMCVRTLEMHKCSNLPNWYYSTLQSVKKSLALEGRLRSSFGYFCDFGEEFS